MKKRIAFLVVVFILLLCGCSKKKESGEKFDGYSIEVGECIYNSITQTGSVELSITGEELGLEKLFYTSEDMLNNGFDIIVDDEYSLRVSDGDRELESQAYEVDYQDETQTIKIYYIDPENSINGNKINIDIIDSQRDKKAKSLKAELKIEDKSVRYSCNEMPMSICMSSTGILMDYSEAEMLEADYKVISLKTKNKEYLMPTDPTTEVKGKKGKEIIKAKKYANAGSKYIFAVHIPEWKNIEKMIVGDYIYANENMSVQTDAGGKIETFYTEDLKTLDAFKNGDIKDCYITNKYTGSNYYYIDEDNVLWGSGYNHYGQLGINHPEDTNSMDKVYEEAQKIAENVIHVDCSSNGYFMVYLTKDNELYGVGANLQGVLGNDIKEEDYLNPWKNVVYTPKLLMRDIVYVRAGRECVIALKKNGDVYWWGEFADEKSREIFGTEPRLVMQKAVYAVTGDNHAAVITSDGELYTWGINRLGQCGAEIDDQYIVEPVKVMDHVRMVWCDEIKFNSSQTKFESMMKDDLWTIHYDNTFVITKDGKCYAAGKNLGNTVISAGFPWNEGDEMESAEYEIAYSAKFLPIKIRKK